MWLRWVYFPVYSIDEVRFRAIKLSTHGNVHKIYLDISYHCQVEKNFLALLISKDF